MTLTDENQTRHTLQIIWIETGTPPPAETKYLENLCFVIYFTTLSSLSDFEYLWLDDCWSDELERIWKEAVLTCSVFNDLAFVWRKKKIRGRPKDSVCPN